LWTTIRVSSPTPTWPTRSGPGRRRRPRIPVQELAHTRHRVGAPLTLRQPVGTDPPPTWIDPHPGPRRGSTPRFPRRDTHTAPVDRGEVHRPPDALTTRPHPGPIELSVGGGRLSSVGRTRDSRPAAALTATRPTGSPRHAAQLSRPAEGGPPPSAMLDAPPGARTGRWTSDELRSHVRAVAERVDANTELSAPRYDTLRSASAPSARTVMRRLGAGSWADACATIGVTPGAKPPDRSDDEKVAAVRAAAVASRGRLNRWGYRNWRRSQPDPGAWPALKSCDDAEWASLCVLTDAQNQD
jgi:hypothetical protein